MEGLTGLLTFFQELISCQNSSHGHLITFFCLSLFKNLTIKIVSSSLKCILCKSRSQSFKFYKQKLYLGFNIFPFDEKLMFLSPSICQWKVFYVFSSLQSVENPHLRIFVFIECANKSLLSMYKFVPDSGILPARMQTSVSLPMWL